MLLINPRLTLQSTTYLLTESMPIHAVVYKLFWATFGLLGIAVLRQFSAT